MTLLLQQPASAAIRPRAQTIRRLRTLLPMVLTVWTLSFLLHGLLATGAYLNSAARNRRTLTETFGGMPPAGDRTEQRTGYRPPTWAPDDTLFPDPVKIPILCDQALGGGPVLPATPSELLGDVGPEDAPGRAGSDFRKTSTNPANPIQPRPPQDGWDLPIDRQPLTLPVRTIFRHRSNCPSCEDPTTAWLARHQEPDGHWDPVRWGLPAARRDDTIATARALIAFADHGNSLSRGEYKDAVRAACEWLVLRQQPNGCIPPIAHTAEAATSTKTHAIAGFALLLSYELERNRDPWLKVAAQKSVDYLVSVQHCHGDELGGWSAAPGHPPDLITTTHCLMLLKEARLCAMKVPHEAFVHAIEFLDRLETPTPIAPPTNPPATDHPQVGRFRRTLADTATNPEATLAGLMARLVLGWPKEEIEPTLQTCLQELDQQHKADLRYDSDPDLVLWRILLAFNIGGSVWDDCLKGDIEHIENARVDNASDDSGMYVAPAGPVTATAVATQVRACFYHCNHQLYTKSVK